MRQNILLVALSVATVASAAERNFTIDTSTIKPSLKGMRC